jgi:hypothetical protein
MNSILYTAGFSELFDTAHESPELDRVLDNMRRHMRTGRYDPDRARHSIERYVVEPSRYRAAQGQGEDGSRTRPSAKTPKVSWFTRYPRDLRAEVARRIVRTWERELKAEG